MHQTSPADPASTPSLRALARPGRAPHAPTPCLPARLPAAACAPSAPLPRPAAHPLPPAPCVCARPAPARPCCLACCLSPARPRQHVRPRAQRLAAYAPSALPPVRLAPCLRPLRACCHAQPARPAPRLRPVPAPLVTIQFCFATHFGLLQPSCNTMPIEIH